jgi:hypothetical protein
MVDQAKENMNIETNTGTSKWGVQEYIPFNRENIEEKKEDNVDIEAAYDKTNAQWKEEIIHQTNVWKTLHKVGEIFKKQPIDVQQDIAQRAPNDKILQENIAQAYQSGKNEYDDMLNTPKKIRNNIKSFFTWSSKKENTPQ